MPRFVGLLTMSAQNTEPRKYTFHSFQLHDFIRSFDNDGPGSVAEDMERGLELIETFAEKVDYFDGQRLDLSEYSSEFIRL